MIWGNKNDSATPEPYKSPVRRWVGVHLMEFVGNEDLMFNKVEVAPNTILPRFIQAYAHLYEWEPYDYQSKGIREIVINAERPEFIPLFYGHALYNQVLLPWKEYANIAYDVTGFHANESLTEKYKYEQSLKVPKKPLPFVPEVKSPRRKKK